MVQLKTANILEGGEMGLPVNSSRSEETEPSLMQSLCTYLDTLYHGACFTITVYFFCISFTPYTIISWHAPLFVASYMLFMTEAFVIFNPSNAVTKNWSKTRLNTLHWTLQTIGLACLMMGCITVVVYKLENNKRHFASNHAIVGLSAIVLTVMASLGGLWSMLCSITRFTLSLSPSHIKIIHVGIGIISYILGVAAVILGLYTHWFERMLVGDEFTRPILITVTVVLASVAVYHSCKGFAIRLIYS